MPWTMENLPDSAKNLTDAQKRKFLEIANAMIKQGGIDEGTIIATAINKAKNDEKNNYMVSEFFDNQWVEIFKIGNQTDSLGNTKNWTTYDLEKIVEQYNTQDKVHEAPVVIGHPKDNAPAFGWVEKLKTDGKVLYAKFKQLVPEFIEIVKQGLYKKRSISLYPDLTLRHVGFLGAVPPAVKGLADIKFNEDNKIIHIEFQKKGDEIPMTVELERQLKDLQKQLKDNETSFNEKIEISKKEIDSLNTQINEKNNIIKEEEIKFNEINLELKKFKNEKKEPELTVKEKEFSEEIKNLKNELNQQKQANRIADFKSFIENLHKEGKIVSDLKSMLVDLLEAIYNTGKANFNENGKVVEVEIIDKFKEYLSKQPKLVAFNEIDLNKQKKNQEESAEVKLNKLAIEYLEKNKELSFAEALTEIQKQNPELVEQIIL